VVGGGPASTADEHDLADRVSVLDEEFSVAMFPDELVEGNGALDEIADGDVAFFGECLEFLVDLRRQVDGEKRCAAFGMP